VVITVPIPRRRSMFPTITPRAALSRLRHDDSGMSTVEYAVGTVAAAAFAAVLYSILSGDSVVAALTGLVQRALSVTF
jgi:Flp pilus assembly pilin Flp